MSGSRQPAASRAFDSLDDDFQFVRLRPVSGPLPPDEVVPPASGNESP